MLSIAGLLAMMSKIGKIVHVVLNGQTKYEKVNFIGYTEPFCLCCFGTRKNERIPYDWEAAMHFIGQMKNNNILSILLFIKY